MPIYLEGKSSFKPINQFFFILFSIKQSINGFLIDMALDPQINTCVCVRGVFSGGKGGIVSFKKKLDEKIIGYKNKTQNVTCKSHSFFIK